MNIFLLISSIIIIILIYFVGKVHERFSNTKIIKEYIKNTENDRNIAMNGIDLKYYINFAFHYKLFNLFEIVIKKLDEKKINYFLIGGGLIGYYRHNNGFIPWDDDIDIGVMEEDREKLHDAINEIIKNDNTIRLGIHDIDKVLIKDNIENPIQIDIFYFKYYSNKNYYNFNMDKLINIWPNQYMFKDEIYPLQTVSYCLYDVYGKIFKEIKIKIPNKAKKYLERCYPNWETIKKPTNSHSKYTKLIFS
jgi:lipopolysaccharide cholinephosphotransferase